MSSTIPTPDPVRRGTPAGATARVQSRATDQWLDLPPRLELGAGGEARVYAHPADPERVVKVRRAPDATLAAKLERMLADPPLGPGGAARGVRLAWPQELVADEEGTVCGFVMPRAEGTRLFELYNPATRRTRAPRCDYALLHRAGWNLAAAFEALHAHGYVVGDVNESNVVTGEDGSVTLVDTDSFQVPGEGGVPFRCAVGKPEYTPPELQEAAFGETDRTPEHDRFGLAVLLFQLLMEGTHPFAARFPGLTEAPPVAERIRGGLFPYRGMWDLTAVPPRLAPPPEILHPPLRRLFHRAFVEGHADPAARPPAAEWRAALAEARAGLVACDANPRHRHGTHLQGCPWCERTALLGGRDPFPDGGGDDADEATRPAGWKRAMTPGRAPVPGLVAAPGGAGMPVPAGLGQGPPLPWHSPPAPAAPVPAAAAMALAGSQPGSVAPPGPVAQGLAQVVHSVGLDSRWAAWSLGMTVAGIAVDGGQQLLAALLAAVFAVAAWNESGGLTRRQLGAGFAFGAAVALLIAAYITVISGMGMAEDGPPRWEEPVELEPVQPLLVPLPAVHQVDEGDALEVRGRSWSALPVNRGQLRQEIRDEMENDSGGLTEAAATLAVEVGPDGTVRADGVQVLESSDSALSIAAAGAYAWARFHPPGAPVRVLVPVRWHRGARTESL